MLATRDGHTGARWAAALDGAGPWRVLMPVHSLAETRLMLGRTPPTLLLIEPALVDGPVHELLRTLQLRTPAERILTLVVTEHEDDTRLLDLLQAGADSILARPFDAQLLAGAVHDALAGGADIAPWVARRLLEHFGVGQPALASQRVEELSNPLALTADEGQLLRRLALGYRLGELAREADVSARELTACVRRIYRKMQWTLRAGDLQLV
ncbi:hypothetical protein [Aquabacterium sp. OR-4]|uniref:hypothetical protein n=1 Tax=Aquabacterium sp. OR-4 TaxID=2978127 RepID=UPI0021B2FE79|nr:hypothetical protein [Aquabacterium sp. OR-4]MDT7834364.1 hypothetical protein [Aquabacterium sp. OR-4]